MVVQSCDSLEADIISAYSKLTNESFLNSKTILEHEALAPKPTVATGFRIGVCFTLVLWCVWDLVVDTESHRENLWDDPAMHLYFAIGNLVLLCWMRPLLVWIWTKKRINFIYIFDLYEVKKKGGGGRKRNHSGEGGEEGLYISQNDRESNFSVLNELENDIDDEEEEEDSYSTQAQVNLYYLIHEACNLTIIFLVSLLFYYKTKRERVGALDSVFPGYTYPTALLLVTIIYLTYPWKGGKEIMWRIFGNVAIAPFGDVNFRESFLADYLTSLVKVFTELSYGLCYVLSGDIVKYDDSDDMGFHDMPNCSGRGMVVFTSILTLLPLTWRLIQCLKRYYIDRTRWPHLGNATKYSLADTVVLFGLLHPQFSHPSNPGFFDALWIISFVCATMYQFFWDVHMDWGLLQFDKISFTHPGSTDFSFIPRIVMGPEDSSIHDILLRKERMVGPPIFYYAAIVVDFFLRFVWTLTLIPQNEDIINGISISDHLIPFFAATEILRRSMWAIFRVELEQVTGARSNKSVPPPRLGSELLPRSTAASMASRNTIGGELVGGERRGRTQSRDYIRNSFNVFSEEGGGEEEEDCCKGDEEKYVGLKERGDIFIGGEIGLGGEEVEESDDSGNLDSRPVFCDIAIFVAALTLVAIVAYITH